MNNRRQDKNDKWVRWVGEMRAITIFLLDKPWLSPWAIPKTINSILRAIGAVAFASNPMTGVFILAAMFVGNINVGLACLLAGIIGVIMSKVLGQPEDLISDGVVVFNGILVGCISVAVFPQLTGLPIDTKFWIILAVFVIITAYIDKGLNALMAPCKLPAQSLPFNFAAVFMLLSLRSSVGLTGTQEPPINTITPEINDTQMFNETQVSDELDWAKVMKGTLLAAGQIYGVGTIDSSILIYLGFFLYSPLLTLFFYVGSLVGTLGGVLFSAPPYTSVYMGLWGYNSLLTSGAMVFFLVPSPSVALAAVVGAFMASTVQASVQHIFGAMMVPVLSYPFNIVVNLILAISTTQNPPFTWVQNKTSPEQHIFQAHRRQSIVGSSELDTEHPLRAKLEPL